MIKALPAGLVKRPGMMYGSAFDQYDIALKGELSRSFGGGMPGISSRTIVVDRKICSMYSQSVHQGCHKNALRGFLGWVNGAQYT